MEEIKGGCESKRTVEHISLRSMVHLPRQMYLHYAYGEVKFREPITRTNKKRDAIASRFLLVRVKGLEQLHKHRVKCSKISSLLFAVLRSIFCKQNMRAKTRRLYQTNRKGDTQCVSPFLLVRVKGLEQLHKRHRSLLEFYNHFGAMAFCKQNAVRFCEPITCINKKRRADALLLLLVRVKGLEPSRSCPH